MQLQLCAAGSERVTLFLHSSADTARLVHGLRCWRWWQVQLPGMNDYWTGCGLVAVSRCETLLCKITAKVSTAVDEVANGLRLRQKPLDELWRVTQLLQISQVSLLCLTNICAQLEFYPHVSFT
jgi:hypothetical protein